MKIHPVFHVDRFRHYHPSPLELGPWTPAKPALVTVDDYDEHIVEGIADTFWHGYPRFEIRSGFDSIFRIRIHLIFDSTGFDPINI